ncbi:tyrosine-protein phosphatase [Nocardioides campestrisoli]|uniref:tyrosine-protein phosphatase n=1 Tax=Nocardioides campestrisoli TaxID=2736757 RepID=UPI00163D9870|nr:tyrosine-protein phosphatase [Nocardioides campestrisoli]
MNSLVNLRDLGGLPVTGGGLTAHGMLYRSDAPHPDDADPEHVPHWPPATVVDLRMEREAQRVPYELPGAERIVHPLHEAAAPENIRDADLGELYRHILETAADRVAGAVTHVVTRPAPALVHCTAGKDRTGIVVASLLLSAGVAPDDVVADYARTGDNMDAVVERIMRFPSRSKKPINPLWLLTPAESMTEVVEVLDDPGHGGARGWLVEHGTPEAALDDWVGRFTA